MRDLSGVVGRLLGRRPDPPPSGEFRRARDLMPGIDAVPTRRRDSFPEIEDETFWRFYEASKDFSLLHVTGFYNVWQSMGHLAANRIPGAFVECGCFLGGVAIFAGLCRRHLGLDGMEIILFDTFEGPPVGSSDMMFGQKIETPAKLPDYRRTVEENIASILGDAAGYRFVEGLVEDTLPVAETGEIALLRLDTDFYSSTKAEFEILYPRLAPGGVLIVDDYGSFQGSRRATDEYLAGLARKPLLNRIDSGVWAGLKP